LQVGLLVGHCRVVERLRDRLPKHDLRELTHRRVHNVQVAIAVQIRHIKVADVPLVFGLGAKAYTRRSLPFVAVGGGSTRAIEDALKVGAALVLGWVVCRDDVSPPIAVHVLSLQPTGR
jgi:hypothetical protein